MQWGANYNLQKLVNEIGKMIKHDINLMDKEGRIIASTDKSRIGQVHEAAQIIIEQGLERFAISDDTSYKGTKMGVNLPLMLEDELVGVVGITGDPNKLDEYGEIIRKVTQMMLQEEHNKQRERISQAIYKNLVCEWLMKVPRDRNDFISRARLLDIEVELERRCIILQPTSCSHHANDAQQLAKAHAVMEPAVQFAVKNWSKGVYLQQENRWIVLIPEISAGGKDFLSFCQEIKEHVEANTAMKLAVGVGCLGKRIEEIQRSFSEAEQAVSISARNLHCGIRLYEEMDVETLFLAISADDKRMYVQRMVGNIPEDKISRYMEALYNVYQFNGSITQAAAQMFVHKNTLQQWLLKIKEYTGYDPRILREGVPLYIAMMLYRELNGQ